MALVVTSSKCEMGVVTSTNIDTRPGVSGVWQSLPRNVFLIGWCGTNALDLLIVIGGCGTDALELLVW